MAEETKPVVDVANSASDLSLVERFKSWLRINLRSRLGDNSLKEALEEVLEEHEGGDKQIPQEEQRMLKNVLELGELTVNDIMTPRSDIQAIAYNVSLEELKLHVLENRHTRVPVYNDTLDNVKGFVHVKDLLPVLFGDSPFNMALILRDVLFVPPSMKVMGLLRRMRNAHVHMAIVIDEFGGTDGLVTLEDLFEEIVGDIQDEHDDEEHEPHLRWSSQNTCDVDARMSIDKLEPELGLSLHPEKEDIGSYDTLGGLIFYELGRVPAVHEIIEHPSGVRFEILAADARRIERIRIFAPAPVETAVATGT